MPHEHLSKVAAALAALNRTEIVFVLDRGKMNA